MTLIRTIMGVMAGLMLALPATAQTSDIRPLSRADAISAKLASVRPAARPCI
uniref:Uncharacterized protein n=1 Tax=Yoonia rhodophyticola TaxID=3137370 RepID=A0AAN0M861_9RHOB